MRTRTKNAIVFAVGGALLASGLAYAAKHRKVADLSTHAIDAIPGGALVVATADLAALRASPVGAPFLKQGREVPGLGKVRDVCGFDPMDTLDEAALAVPAAGDTGDFGVAATGRVDPDAILACAGKIIEARGGKPIITTIGTFRSVHDATMPATGGEIAVRKGGPLLLGGGAYLRAMVDAVEGRVPTAKSSLAHAALGKELGDAASVRVTFVLTPEQRRTLLEELGSSSVANPASSVVAAGAGARIGSDVALHAVVATNDPAAATKLAAGLDEARLAKVDDYSFQLVGFGELFKSVKISVDGELVHLRVTMPADHASVLLDRAMKLGGLRHPMPSDNPVKLGPPGAASATAAPSARVPTPDDVIGKPDAGKR